MSLYIVRALRMRILLVCPLNMGFTLPSWAALHTSYLEGELIHISFCLKPAICSEKDINVGPTAIMALMTAKISHYGPEYAVLF